MVHLVEPLRLSLSSHGTTCLKYSCSSILAENVGLSLPGSVTKIYWIYNNDKKHLIKPKRILWNQWQTGHWFICDSILWVTLRWCSSRFMGRRWTRIAKSTAVHITVTWLQFWNLLRTLDVHEAMLLPCVRSQELWAWEGRNSFGFNAIRSSGQVFAAWFSTGKKLRLH